MKHQSPKILDFDTLIASKKHVGMMDENTRTRVRIMILFMMIALVVPIITSFLFSTAPICPDSFVQVPVNFNPVTCGYIAVAKSSVTVRSPQGDEIGLQAMDDGQFGMAVISVVSTSLSLQPPNQDQASFRVLEANFEPVSIRFEKYKDSWWLLLPNGWSIIDDPK